jgi:hypothetical protein
MRSARNWLGEMNAGELLAAVFGETRGAGRRRGGLAEAAARPCHHLAVMRAHGEEFMQGHDEGDIGLAGQRAQRVCPKCEEVVEIDQPHIQPQQDRLQLAPHIAGAELIEMVVAQRIADHRIFALGAQHQFVPVCGRADRNEDCIHSDTKQAFVERIGSDLGAALADRWMRMRHDRDRARQFALCAVGHQPPPAACARLPPKPRTESCGMAA